MLLLAVHAVPGARATAWAGRHGQAWRIRLAAPPSDGRANAALLAFIAAELDLPKSAVRLRQGASARQKLLEIDCPLSSEALHQAIAQRAGVSDTKAAR